MEQSEQEKFEDILANRLIRKVEEDTNLISRTHKKTKPSVDRETKNSQHNDGRTQTLTSEPTESSLLTAEFIKVEKSLAGLGFFTPSSRRLKNQKVKEIRFSRKIGGRRVEATAQIVPSALFGLPVTADQDKYLALQKIITAQMLSTGEVSNPIRFKSADLLRILNRSTKAGKNYKEVSEWLDVMTTTTIISNGVVYHAGQKRVVRDRLHIFDRAVSFGKELEDGSIADANYVWLSSWQLANINNNFLLPIDFDTYRELKNHIAKALVPLLQIWLFASQRSGSFEKRYDELCEILNIQTYKTPSQILRQLKPSLDELTRFEYLAKWRIEKTVDKKAHKIIFFHGPKFHRDRRKRLKQKIQAESPVVIGQYEPVEDNLPEHGRLREIEVAPAKIPTAEVQTDAPAGQSSPAADKTAGERAPAGMTAGQANVVTELTDRGVMKSVAAKLVRSIAPDQIEDVHNQIDYWDSIAPDRERGKGPGLLLHLIKKNDPLPPAFESRRQRQERVAAEEKSQKLRLIKSILIEEYEKHRSGAVDRFIAEELTAAEFESRVASRKQDLSRQSGLWENTQRRPQLLDQMARHEVRGDIANEVSILRYEDFRRRELPRILEEHHLDPAELGIELPKPPVSESKPPS